MEEAKFATKEIKISDLKPAKYNPRFMTDEEFDELEKSLKFFGLVEPIICNKDLTVIGGHQRLIVWEKMGHTTITCNVLDLSKKEEKILNLALNKISGNWNEEQLSDLIFEIKNEAIGFNEEEVNQFLMQREIRVRNEEEFNPDDDEDTKKRLDQNEKIAIGVEDPGATKRKDRLAFYVETFDEYDAIRNFFKTDQTGELDKNKLLETMNK